MLIVLGFWVRETWRHESLHDATRTRGLPRTKHLQYDAGVCIEWLSNCDEASVHAKGVRAGRTPGGDDHDEDGQTARAQLINLWNGIQGAGSWGAPPFVRVVEFRRIR